MIFLGMRWGTLCNEYFNAVRLFYNTRYDNLVLGGQLRNRTRFFFVAGVHDKGFPWGDGELFSDVLLVIGERRYAISDRALPGLELDIAAGVCRYRGPLLALRDGDAVLFSEMREQPPSEAQIEIAFRARAFATVPFPSRWLPCVRIRPHTAAILSGSIRMAGQGWQLDPAASFGECERGTFCLPKWPRLTYHYFCALHPEWKSVRVQTLSKMSSAEIVLENGRLRVERPGAGLEADPLIEVHNDHFPTAVFERRVVEVRKPEPGLALEERMSGMRLAPLHSRRTAVVASIRDEDKLAALDRVLEATGFEQLLEQQLAASGKPRASFSIAIKPNFMFAYHRRDRSTYTDPELVHHLVRRLRGRGFERIRVVESQCSYGEYFDRRSVREMAEYLGFDQSAGYEVVDMTLDADECRHLGPALGCHPVSRAWREADFRISFAKNKTHAYAFYSLALKNIYGALPLPDKFREYHCGRGIYATTIEYLSAFPVHFGIIDAWLSADGPFGVFASPVPKRTATILGGPDLVALDWVGASKMGLDPLLSPHMQAAVRVFGKPRIRLIGEASPYRPWRNVPRFLTLLTNRGMDANYRIGRLLYTISAQMDEDRFHLKSNAWYVKLLRVLTVPVRHTLFLCTREDA